MTVLDEILAATRAECARLSGALPPAVAHTPLDVRARLRRAHGALRLIAEIKKRSPSAGALSTELTVAERADVYARQGATMISVLVDVAHFSGGYPDLSAARGVGVPLLAKGFTIDDVQLEAARRAGADAVLIIARILEDPSLRDLVEGARARQLCPIVEVVDERELERALAAGAEVIGVNARDLSTLRIDRDRAARVLDAVPADRVSLWFSGVSTPEEVAAIAATRADGALIGEALMRRDDPAELLRAMVAATR